MPETIGSPTLWVAFTAFIVAMLALDLGVLHRDAHEVGVREALWWSLVWVALSLIFAAGLHRLAGPTYALQFVTGYLIEKALSVDNVFVFLVVFSFFKVPARLQHRVLFWGIFGALLMRAAFIMAGAALIARFEWIMYVFGALLVFTGINMLRARETEMQPEEVLAYRMFRRVVPSTDSYRDGHFFVRENGRLLATPLAAVLVVVESSDLMFAVDSIPAIFAVTRDPFLVYTSNVFAILGLRAMFFLLAGIIDKFAYLKTGLAIVLTYVGVKMLIIEYFHVPPGVSLAVVAGIIGGAIAWSLIAPPRHAAHDMEDR
jgi:tellurite resistance protein TerC